MNQPYTLHILYTQVTHTNPDQSSLSLLRNICYPETVRFTSTAYGCTHEKDAIQAFKSTMTEHSSFIIKPCGFLIDQSLPFIGASPDGLLECKCCGKGVLEVKCPWIAKDEKSLESVAENRKEFCLQKNSSGSLQLRRDHPYFLQCQVQLHVSESEYCFFVVWQKAGIHVERILPDHQFIQSAYVKAEQFNSLDGVFFQRLRENGLHEGYQILLEVLEKYKHSMCLIYHVQSFMLYILHIMTKEGT